MIRSQPSITDLLARAKEMPSSLNNACRTIELMADEIGALKARVAELEGVLQFIADGYDNHDVNHVDYRVKVYQVATEALSHAGPVARDGER